MQAATARASREARNEKGRAVAARPLHSFPISSTSVDTIRAIQIQRLVYPLWIVEPPRRADSDARVEGHMMQPFSTHSAAAWAILDACRSGQMSITRKAAGFLGETAIDPTPLSEKQRHWLVTMLTRAELPPLAGGDA